ncbi:MAG TPA: DNA-3-methyladenine glycosylase [Solirubrobacteraceae bacterium]|nr:DNA-3-methyladenine glycosylase [Solirubrobacteraceae bacterium]
MNLAGLDPGFYARDVVEVARDLIGCVVSHDGVSGIIVETEAYHDSEPACHAFVGLTPRTETLFGPPGRAYVYRSYGIHSLLNAVCEPCGVGAAVLIRALEPVEGVSVMRARRGVERIEDLCSGPGKLTQALGVELVDNGADLQVGPLVIAPRPAAWRDVAIVSGPRIGITKAVELPWRFCAAGSRFVSGRLPVVAGAAEPAGGLSALT